MTAVQFDKLPASVGALLEWRVEQTPTAEAFRYPDASDFWLSMTWREAYELASQLAAGLLSLGLEPEQRVAICSNTRIEWVLIDLAINMAGGATTTIYPNTQADEFSHIVSHSDSVVLVAENESHLGKLENAALNVVRHIVLMDGVGDGERVLSWQQLIDRGKALLADDPDAVVQAIAATTGDKLATLIYTSGTTGLPKGVELLHRNWVYEGFAVGAMKIVDATDLQHLWLPLSHVFGKCLIACQLAIGFASSVDGRLDRIVPSLGEVHPTFMCGAPRIFEKVRATVMTSSPTGGVKGRIARWAFAVGRDSRPYRLEGRPLPRALAARYAIADRLVFSKLKARMGGRLDFFMSGSAKLSRQVQEWFYSAGLTVVEGYGMTETSAISFINHPVQPRFGTVGRIVPDSEVKLAEDGEILLRGPGVMRGYHKDPERTAEVLIDGWFHTGDIGSLDAEGHLTITDRKKDLLKTSGGKYVAPQKVESAISANIPYVSQVVAVGDGRKYVSALLTLDRDSLQRWAKRRGKENLSYEELTQLPEIHASIERFMNRANSKLERWETVKRFAILDHEFTVDDGGITANMKIRRSIIAEKYADVVDSLYDEE